MSDDLTTLAGTEATVWRLLEESAGNPATPTRIVGFATQSAEGGGAVRMVVLRKADRLTRSLTFYTHRSSQKVADIQSEPSAEILFWDAGKQFQIRLRGKVMLSDGPSEIWDTFRDGTRRNYAAEPAAGDKIDHPEDIAGTPDPATFVVLTLVASTVETLWLGGAVHHRARFSDGASCWLAP